MKIYTKTGDSGETGLFGGPRVPKDDLRIEAYGTVDELNSVLGMLVVQDGGTEVNSLLTAIQNHLFDVGAELATPDPESRGTSLIGDQAIARLEQAIDHFYAQLPTLTQFILPGGSQTGALLHFARTVCRRAERRTVSLARADGIRISLNIIRYLNRLSDLLFVLARFANQQNNCPVQVWQPSA